MPDLVPSRPLVKRPSRWGRWFRAVEFAVQLTLAVGYVLYAVRYYQITTRLNETLAQMDRTDPGWRLQDIEAARAVVPDAENSALRVMDAGKLLPKEWIEEDFEGKLFRIPPEQQLSPEQYGRLRRSLDSAQPALDAARGLSGLPNGRFPIVYTRIPCSNLLAGETKAGVIVRLLDLDAMALAQAGETRAAAGACRAAVNAGRSIGDEPLAISQLARAKCVEAACRTLQRVLAEGEPEPDDLKSLQFLLEKEDAHPYWPITVRGNRAVQNAFLESLESGEVSESEASFEGLPSWRERLFAFAFQDKVRVCHPQLFTYMARIEAADTLPYALRISTLHRIALEVNRAGPNPATMFVLTYPLLAEVFAHCHAVLRCQAAGLAVERYRRVHGDWPQSLDQLAPDFLASASLDPFAGDGLLYRRLPDGVVIYSVGKDGVDDDGDVDAQTDAPPGTDVGIRLWDVAKRRQPPAAPPNRP